MVGTPYANRSRPELQHLAGCMINTLALRTSIADDPTYEHLLKGVSKGVVDAFAHADAPFAQVVQALKQPRSASFTPVYQVGQVLADNRAEVLAPGHCRRAWPQG